MQHRLLFPNRGDWINSNFMNCIFGCLSPCTYCWAQWLPLRLTTYQLLDERLIYSEMINESGTAWFQLELAVVKLCQLLSAPCSMTLLKKKLPIVVSPLKRLQKARQLHSKFLESVLLLSMKTPHECDWVYLVVGKLSVYCIYMCIYLYIERKTYFALKMAWKCTQSSLLLLLNRFSKLWRVISPEWPVYYNKIRIDPITSVLRLCLLYFLLLLSLTYCLLQHARKIIEHFLLMTHCLNAALCQSSFVSYKLLTRAYSTESQLALQGEGLRPKVKIGEN